MTTIELSTTLLPPKLAPSEEWRAARPDYLSVYRLVLGAECHANNPRLGAQVSQWDAESAGLSLRADQPGRDNEELRGAIGRLEKDRGHEVDEQSREVSELVTREAESHQRLESLVSEKAESGILANILQNRVASLDEEVGKLRRQVHDLQQESAAREVTVTQLNKWREQDQEDIKGLNIALDLKQQELELVRPFSSDM
jgi:polyhydroxyalkanoate synthesis regulator phasin